MTPIQTASLVAGEKTAEQIAGGLTAAQRMALRKATRTVDGRWLAPSCSVSRAEPWPEGMAQYYSWASDSLTPLGLRVRAILTGAA